MIEMKLYGMDELDRRLKQFPINLQRDIVDRALKAGGEPIIRWARNRAPIQKGAGGGMLRKSITSKLTYDPQTRMRSLYIGVFKKGFYGRFIEHGWMPTGPRGSVSGLYIGKGGNIRKARGDKMTWRDWRARKQQGNTKVPAHPWLKPSFDANTWQSLTAIADTMRKYINGYGGR